MRVGRGVTPRGERGARNRGDAMSRNILNLIVDVLTFVGLMVVALSGLLMKFVLPSGSPRMGLTLFGWDRHVWGEFHFWATAGLGAVLVVHLALHWRWVCMIVGRCVTGKRNGAMPAWQRNIVGVAWLVIVVGVTTGLLGGAKTLVQRGTQEDGRQRGASAATMSGEIAAESRGDGLRRRAARSAE